MPSIRHALWHTSIIFLLEDETILSLKEGTRDGDEILPSKPWGLQKNVPVA